MARSLCQLAMVVCQWPALKHFRPKGLAKCAGEQPAPDFLAMQTATEVDRFDLVASLRYGLRVKKGDPRTIFQSKCRQFGKLDHF